MAETIEAFIAKLQKEGVQAGQEAAEKVLAKTHEKADAIVAEAEAKAKQIVEAAKSLAAGDLAKAKTEMELAARDTVLRLREALSRAVRQVLAAGVKEPLTSPEFLKGLLYDIVLQYVQADLGDKATFRINLAPEMRQKLAEWAMQHLRQKADLKEISIDLKGTLAEAGFEYQVDGANVEVTQSAVVEVLTDLVNPAIREMIERAIAENE